MKNKTFFVNTALAATLGVAMLAFVIARVFLPALILPEFGVPGVVIVSVIALLLEYYFGPDKKPCIICVALLAILTFAVLPLAAGYVAGMEAVKYGVVGGLIFTFLSFVFASIKDRITSGVATGNGEGSCKVARFLAPILTAIGIVLASQAMAGIWL